MRLKKGKFKNVGERERDCVCVDLCIYVSNIGNDWSVCVGLYTLKTKKNQRNVFTLGRERERKKRKQKKEKLKSIQPM